MKSSKDSKTRRIFGAGFMASAIICGAVLDASAQDSSLGKELYAEACGVCHGSSGLGDGEFAQHLNVRPSNLTTLAKENNGEFPYLQVFQITDGRTGVRGHGGGDMPIWGSVFSREVGEMGGPYGSELLIRARLVSLVDYIESLQAE